MDSSFAACPDLGLCGAPQLATRSLQRRIRHQHGLHTLGNESIRTASDGLANQAAYEFNAAIPGWAVHAAGPATCAGISLDLTRPARCRISFGEAET